MGLFRRPRWNSCSGSLELLFRLAGMTFFFDPIFFRIDNILIKQILFQSLEKARLKPKIKKGCTLGVQPFA
jgi:hypothetical protein